jgi:predicted transcriptional regulator
MARQPNPPPNDTIEFEDPGMRAGFAQVPRLVLKARGLSDKAKVVYALLLDYAWQQGSCFPGQRRLASDLDTTDRTIRSALNELRDYGLIDWKQRGLNQTNVYYIRRLDRVARLQAATQLDSTLDRKISSAPDRRKSSAQDRKKTSDKEDSGLIDPEVIDSPISTNRDVSLSKFREGTAKNSAVENPEAGATLPAQGQPSGFASVASVLAEASHATGRHIAAALPAEPGRTQKPATAAPTAPDGVSPVSEAQPALSTVSGPKTPRRARRSPVADDEPRYSEDRALVTAHIRDFAAEFHDQASTKASVTRALRLLSESGYPRERWSEKLYEARGLTKERSAAIGYQGDSNPRTGQTAFGLNKMPYFFGVLECVLGLHDHPAGQHPMPLSEQEFKRQQGKKGQQERTSLAGRYAHLVQR